MEQQGIVISFLVRRWLTTPCWMSMVSDNSPAHLTLEVQSVYKSRTSSQSSPWIPSRYSLLNRELWPTTSNAFWISSVVIRRSCLLFLTLGLEVIKLEYSLKLKIKSNDWLLADTCKIKPTRNDKKDPTFRRIRAGPTGHDRPSTRRGLVNESKCQVLHITRIVSEYDQEPNFPSRPNIYFMALA